MGGQIGETNLVKETVKVKAASECKCSVDTKSKHKREDFKVRDVDS